MNQALKLWFTAFCLILVSAASVSAQTTVESPNTTAPNQSLGIQGEIPDEVCGLLSVIQEVFLPILEYLNDPISLVEVFLANGNCAGGGLLSVEHGMIYTMVCPAVSGAAGIANSFFSIIGAESYISGVGNYVKTFHITFNTVILTFQTGLGVIISAEYKLMPNKICLISVENHHNDYFIVKR